MSVLNAVLDAWSVQVPLLSVVIRILRSIQMVSAPVTTSFTLTRLQALASLVEKPVPLAARLINALPAQLTSL